METIFVTLYRTESNGDGTEILWEFNITPRLKKLETLCKKNNQFLIFDIKYYDSYVNRRSRKSIAKIEYTGEMSEEEKAIFEEHLANMCKWVNKSFLDGDDFKSTLNQVIYHKIPSEEVRYPSIKPDPLPWPEN